MKELHDNLDKIISDIDRLKKEGQTFYDEYNKHLEGTGEKL
jgi:hypothetical protein